MIFPIFEHDNSGGLIVMQRSNIFIAHYYIIYTCMSILLQLAGILASGWSGLKILAGNNSFGIPS